MNAPMAVPIANDFRYRVPEAPWAVPASIPKPRLGDMKSIVVDIALSVHAGFAALPRFVAQESSQSVPGVA
jgi:hypothetical protein